MSLAHIKEEFMNLSYEEQDRLTEMFQSIRLSRNTDFLKKQNKTLNKKDDWVSLDNLKNELNL